MRGWPALFFLAALLVPGAVAAQMMPRLSQDTKQPIEITADNLEVQQQQRLAVFKGNVDARQGEIRLAQSHAFATVEIVRESADQAA